MDREGELGDFEVFHFAGHQLGARRNGARRSAAATGKPHLRVWPFPWSLVVALQPFVRLFREMAEMRYLWSAADLRSTAASSRPSRRRLPATPLDVAVRDTLVGLGCLRRSEPRSTRRARSGKPDTSASILVGRSAAASSPFLQQPFEIEPARVHLDAAVGRLRPFLARAVPIEFDAVFVGVAQIQRLADAVVGGAVERDAGRRQTAQRVGERGAGRIERWPDGTARSCRAPAAIRPGFPRC